jgi:hypothetical protein
VLHLDPGDVPEWRSGEGDRVRVIAGSLACAAVRQAARGHFARSSCRLNHPGAELPAQAAAQTANPGDAERRPVSGWLIGQLGGPSTKVASGSPASTM